MRKNSKKNIGVILAIVLILGIFVYFYGSSYGRGIFSISLSSLYQTKILPTPLPQAYVYATSGNCDNTPADSFGMPIGYGQWFYNGNVTNNNFIGYNLAYCAGIGYGTSSSSATYYASNATTYTYYYPLNISNMTQVKLALQADNSEYNAMTNIWHIWVNTSLSSSCGFYCSAGLGTVEAQNALRSIVVSRSNMAGLISYLTSISTPVVPAPPPAPSFNIQQLVNEVLTAITGFLRTIGI